MVVGREGVEPSTCTRQPCCGFVQPALSRCLTTCSACAQQNTYTWGTPKTWPSAHNGTQLCKAPKHKQHLGQIMTISTQSTATPQSREYAHGAHGAHMGQWAYKSTTMTEGSRSPMHSGIAQNKQNTPSPCNPVTQAPESHTWGAVQVITISTRPHLSM